MFSLSFIALRNLGARRFRTLLSVVAVGLGVGLVLGTQVTTEALQSRSRALADQLLGRADLEVRSFSDRGFSVSMVDAVSALPETGVVTSRLTKRTAADLGGEHGFVLLAGIDLDREMRFHDLQLSEGRWFRPTEHTGVVLARPLAEAHGTRVGEHVKLVTAAGLDTFTVVGILASGGLEQLNFGRSVFVSLDTAQTLFHLGARVEQLEVKLRDGSTEIQFRHDLGLVATQDYEILNRASVTDNPGQLLAGVAPLALGLTVLSFFVGMFLLFNTLAMNVIERRREIGLLRAAGASGRQVAGIFLTQALWLGVMGSLTGVVFGYLVAVAVLTAVNFGPLPAVASGLPISPVSLGLSFLLGVSLCLLAGIVPSRRAASLTPLNALRPSGALVATRTGSLRVGLGLLALVGGVVLLAWPPADPLRSGLGAGLALAGLALLLPVYLPVGLRLAALLISPLGGTAASLAGRSLVRTRGRTSITVAGIGIASAALVALGGLSTSTRAEGGRWVNSLFVGSYVMVSPVPQDLGLRDQFTALPGVLAASPVRFFSVRSGSMELSAAAIEPLPYASVGELRFVEGDPRGALVGLQGDQVLLPERAAERLSAHAGDVVSIQTEAGPVPFKVAGVLYHSLPSPGRDEAALFSLDTARQHFGITTFNLLQIVPGSAQAPDPVLLRRQALQYGMDMVSVADMAAAVDRSISSLILLLQALAGIGVLISLMGIINTMLMNVAEGQREFGLLRAVGFSQGQLERLVLAQAGIMGLCGAAGGVGVGILLLVALTRGTTTPTFQPQVTFPALSVLTVLVTVTVACLLAAVVPARRSARLSIVAAVRAE